MELKGKQLLITRPDPENHLSSEFFQSQGASIVSLPMMQIQALDQPQEKAYIQSQIFNLDEYQKVIFISKNAVRHGLEWIDHCWPQVPFGIEWIGIGAGTTQYLNQIGYEMGIQSSSHNSSSGDSSLNNSSSHSKKGNTSEDLLAHPSLQNVAEEKILILKGEGGRTTLAETLESRLAKVNSLALYKRAKITYSLEQLTTADAADLILITSGEGLENLTEVLTLRGKNWFNKLILTPSQRVADQATELGWQKVINAKGADDQSLLAALIQL